MSQLILCPEDSHWQDDECILEPLLLRLELIQPQKINDSFLPGERFLNLLSFMGCSPNIQIDFDSNNPKKAFCSVKMVNFVDPLLLVSDNSRPPKCPNCRKSVSHWQANNQNQLFNCKHCQTPIKVETLNWKQQGGYAKTMIIIDNIYHQEALPTDLLLNALKTISHCKWQYFYKF